MSMGKKKAAGLDLGFNFGTENDAYYGNFSESGFSLGGGKKDEPVVSNTDEDKSTVRVPPVALAVGGALALVLLMLALSK